VVGVVALFIVGVGLGLLDSSSFEHIVQMLRPKAQNLKALPWFGRALWLFVHNAVAAYVPLALAWPSGVLASLVALINGFVMGVFSHGTYGFSGFLLKVAPHGCFELPASLLAWGSGLWRGFARRYAEPEERRAMLAGAHAVYLWFVLPLLAIAAVIEAL
jgi:uncharacterized membrane protein SpoIIM required for sporulation